MTHIYPNPNGDQIISPYVAGPGVQAGYVYRDDDSKHVTPVIHGSISESGRLELSNR